MLEVRRPKSKKGERESRCVAYQSVAYNAKGTRLSPEWKASPDITAFVSSLTFPRLQFLRL